MPSGRELETNAALTRASATGLMWTIPAFVAVWVIAIGCNEISPLLHRVRALWTEQPFPGVSGVLWLLLGLLVGGCGWVFLGAVPPDRGVQRWAGLARWAVLLVAVSAGIGLLWLGFGSLPIGTGTVSGAVGWLAGVAAYTMVLGLAGLIALGFPVLGSHLSLNGMPRRGARVARLGLVLGVVAGASLLGQRMMHLIYWPEPVQVTQSLSQVGTPVTPPSWAYDAMNVLEILVKCSLLLAACVAWVQLLEVRARSVGRR